MNEQTLVAVYTTAAHADAAIRDLKAASVPAGSISQHTQQAAGTHSTTPVREEGFWSKLFGTESQHDSTLYEQSIASGSTVVSVKIQENQFDRVSAILEKHDPIDIEENEYSAQSSTTRLGGAAAAGTSTSSFRSNETSGAGSSASGSHATGASHLTETSGSRTTETAGSRVNEAASSLAQGAAALGTSAKAKLGAAGEETLQLAEEALSVGKRAVEGGATRIRKYVVSTPVEEQVRLRDEKVTIERRPVTDGRPVAGESFADKTIEMRETREEAVVSKEARVKEEIGLRKEAAERVETVKDNVRREEVDIQKGEKLHTGSRTETEKAGYRTETDKSLLPGSRDTKSH